MNLDLHNVPFSYRGSYFAFSLLPGGLYLRTMHGGARVQEIARIDLVQDGEAQPFSIQAAPACLHLQSEAGFVEICFEGEKSLRMQAVGVGLRLDFPEEISGTSFPAYSQSWQVNCFVNAVNLMLLAHTGRWQKDIWSKGSQKGLAFDLLPGSSSEAVEAVIEEFDSAFTPHPVELDFADCVERARAEFHEWLSRTMTLPEVYEDSREMAAYIGWSSMVAAKGHLMRPAMLMSKNWMTRVWSWDHCFNALALVEHSPSLAWDQLMLMFDLQDREGSLPDAADDQLMVWTFCKPPVHGWTLLKMLQRTDWITAFHLDAIYGPLSRWTNWWLRTRDYDRDGIPQYHHGNDSGWDNCTAFNAGLPLESPDLSAFLVIQMEALSRVAAKIGLERDAETWQRRSNELLERMLVHFWRGDHFVVTQSGVHQDYWSESLFYFLPIVLGKRLPLEIQRAVVKGLKASGLITANGLATENPSSPSYLSDGYWRGPIWAPATLLILDGLAALGEADLARSLARSFCELCASNGMAENFDAITGKGLRDQAFTWTASVFLISGHDYLT